jgi:hypothetical protein
MRTEVILMLAAMGALCGLPSQAQVFSSHVVGYVQVTIDSTTRSNGTFAMITNPLDQGAGNYAVSKLIPAPPEGTILFVFPGRAYEPANIFELGSWGNTIQQIEPGQGAFIKVPGGQSLTITFVGEVRQGAGSNRALMPGYNMIGSLVPQAGGLTSVLGYVPAEGDLVYKYRVAQQAYDPVYIYELGAWGPSEPILEVGEAVFIKPAGALTQRTWNRDFDVNAP